MITKFKLRSTMLPGLDGLTASATASGRDDDDALRGPGVNDVSR